MRRLAVLLAAALVVPAPVAVAQTPTVTAEATETVRVKPTQAKLTVYAQVKNPDATVASDESAEVAKTFTEAVGKLKVKVTVSPLPPKASKVGPNDDAGGVVVAAPVAPGGPPAPPKETQVSRPLVVTVTAADFKALTEAVDLVQKEAGKANLEGEKKTGVYNPFGQSAAAIKVKYTAADGWDAATAAALSKATKAATFKAQAIADGLGMKLGAVVSAGEVDVVEQAKSASLVAAVYGNDTEPAATDDLVDGELVRTVRVRVAFQVTK
jgi:uncharacterized protein YggE